ncbi:MAG: hypothetical protein ACO1N3_02270 [Gammaproteobacteria bacterium]
MAVSLTVKNTLRGLQTYYKGLYFFRWFFPKQLKNNLNRLEKLHLNTEQDTVIVNLVNDLYLSLRAPDWYTKVFFFFFSKVYDFAQSDLMQQITLLNNAHLANEENLTIMLEWVNIKSAVEGLQIIAQTGVIVHERKRELIANILKVRACDLTPQLSNAFYKKMAEKASLGLGFSESIKVLQTDPRFVPYIKVLLPATEPNALALALCKLIPQGLVPSVRDLDTPIPEGAYQSEAQKHLRLKKIILQEIQNLSNSSSIADAVLVLKQHTKLEEANFRILVTSADPVGLAQLIVEFGDDLNQSMLPQLEQHRLNLAVITPQRTLSLSQKKNIAYCRDLAEWLRQTDPVVSDELFELHDQYYDIFEQERANLCRVMPMLNRREIWENPCLPLFKEFLVYGRETGQFLVYAELLARFASQPGLLVNEGQVNTVFEIVKNCVNAAELLQRCSRSSNDYLSLDFLQALAIQINGVPVVARTYSPSPGLKHRRVSILPSATNENNLEGAETEDKPKTTPSKTTPTRTWGGVLVSAVTTVVKLTGIWQDDAVQNGDNSVQNDSNTSADPFIKLGSIV